MVRVSDAGDWAGAAGYRRGGARLMARRTIARAVRRAASRSSRLRGSGFRLWVRSGSRHHPIKPVRIPALAARCALVECLAAVGSQHHAPPRAPAPPAPQAVAALMPRHRNGSTARPIEGGVSKRTYRTSQSAQTVAAAQHLLTRRPDRPCSRCGAAGFCGHEGRLADLWEA